VEKLVEQIKQQESAAAVETIMAALKRKALGAILESRPAVAATLTKSEDDEDAQ
jgi:hypothetical protein